MAILCGHSAQLPLPGLSQEVGLASPCDSLLASETELLLPVSCPAPFMGKVTGGGGVYVVCVHVCVCVCVHVHVCVCVCVCTCACV